MFVVLIIIAVIMLISMILLASIDARLVKILALGEGLRITSITHSMRNGIPTEVVIYAAREENK